MQTTSKAVRKKGDHLFNISLRTNLWCLFPCYDGRTTIFLDERDLCDHRCTHCRIVHGPPSPQRVGLGQGRGAFGAKVFWRKGNIIIAIIVTTAARRQDGCHHGSDQRSRFGSDADAVQTRCHGHCTGSITHQTVQTFQMDLSDLSAVSRAADDMVASMDHIDILINNAGMHAGLDFRGKDASVGDNPPYDRVFVVNFLSHVLLTEKLMPLLAKSNKPVIAQTSSSFHWASDGSDLVPKPTVAMNGKFESSKTMPIAARPGGSTGFFLFRTQRSYANSKLAQIYHARMLKRDAARLLGNGNNNLRVVSICPSWVATGIVRGSSFLSYFLETFAFPMEGWGIASTLHALFDDDEQSGHDWYTNSYVFRITEFLIPSGTPSWMYSTLPVRDALVGAFAPLALFLQPFTAHAGPSKSSPESYNESKADALYTWSKNAVAQYL